MVIASVQIGLGTGGAPVNYLTRYYGFSCVFIFTIAVLSLKLVYATVVIPPIDDSTEKNLHNKSGMDYGRTSKSLLKILAAIWCLL